VRIFKGAFVSHKLFPSILLACALFAFPALAQTGAAPKAAASATNKADVLTPDQAKRALDTLQDDKKRAQMIDTLRAIANASPQAQAAPPAPGPQPAIPLTADSLGAQLLLTVSEQVGEISHEIADMARTLTNFPAFYFWIVRTANDPSAYNQLLDIAWKLALVFGCAFAAEWLIFRVIKRPVALLEARLPQTARASVQMLAVVESPSPAANVTAVSQTDRFEAGSVFLPERADWLDSLIVELLAFPAGRHDDQVDALVQGMAWARDQWLPPVTPRIVLSW